MLEVLGVLAATIGFFWSINPTDFQIGIAIVIAMLIIQLLWERNLHPETFMALCNPEAYFERKRKEELSASLERLLTAVEADDPFETEQAVKKARDVLGESQPQGV